MVQSITKTGALCCVAAGPHGSKPGTELGVGDNSTDRGQPHWRTNSSFSPPPSRIWDCRLQSDVLPRGYGTNRLSFSSNRKRRRSRLGSDRITSHHHSVSDGVLSYNDSPPNSAQASRRWTSPIQKFKVGEMAGPSVGGSRSEASPYPPCTERYIPVKAAAASPSFGSPSSFSEFDTWESTRQQPYFLPGRHSRRSHLSKAVYPMLFHNPVSDFETFDDAQASSLGRSTPGEDRISPSYWHEDGLYREDKFYRALAELRKLEASPDLNTSSRRDGFRWSNASSYDLGFDGERCVITDNTDREETASPHGRGVDQKCGICGKLLQQKSPWSSHRILRGNDMPIAGVLPCSHVFHADCLEHMTPKTQIHDPPCPLCLKYLGPTSESPFVKESLQMALRSLRRSRGVVIDEDLLDQNDKASAHTKDRLKRKWPWVVQRWNIGGSSLGNQLKRHLLFKGSSSKDLCHKRVSDKASSSSSKLPVVDHVFSSSPVSSS